MGNKKIDWGESESGNWNVAADYVKVKIMKHLSLIDDYISICQFGTIDLPDEFILDENIINTAKMKSIKRLVKTMRMLIGNTKFALKKADKDAFEDFKKELKSIWSILPSLDENISSNGKVIKVRINEEKFYMILDILEEIHEDMLEPLNKADLIFTSIDEFDPEKFKYNIKKRMAESG